MRRILTLAALLAAATVIPAQAAGVCSVTPNPVSLSADTTYTVHATGLTPNAYYDIRVDQNNQQFGHHDDVSGVLTDAAGSFDALMFVDNPPRDSLVLGEATAHVKRSSGFRPSGQGGCQVSFTVIP